MTVTYSFTEPSQLRKAKPQVSASWLVSEGGLEHANQ